MKQLQKLQVKQKFYTYEVRLDIQSRFEFLDVKHFKLFTITFSPGEREDSGLPLRHFMVEQDHIACMTY